MMSSKTPKTIFIARIKLKAYLNMVQNAKNFTLDTGCSLCLKGTKIRCEGSLNYYDISIRSILIPLFNLDFISPLNNKFNQKNYNWLKGKKSIHFHPMFFKSNQKKEETTPNPRQYI